MAIVVGKRSAGTGPTLQDGSRAFRVYALGLLIAALAVLIPGLARSRSLSLATLLIWMAAVAASNLFPVRTNHRVHLTLDMPVLLAAGFVLAPIPAGLIALLATVDREEWTDPSYVWTGVANRAQTALTVMAASATFTLLGGRDWEWPQVAAVALMAVVTDVVVNYALVTCGNAIRWHMHPIRAMRELALGPPGTFALAYASHGFISVILAALVHRLGTAAVLLVVAPLILAHQSFGGRAKLHAAQGRLATQGRAVLEANNRLAEERRDERFAVAGELHDEVLPPLFKVHLMGQVLKHDLASGRLLDLDEDVPELLSATEAAQSAIRGVVSGLRRSPLGAAGLNGTLDLLADQLSTPEGPRFELLLHRDEWPGMVQLLIYQVAREAMDNSAKHARASVVRVVTTESDGRARVVVEDDGVGFAPPSEAHSDHFGLQLVRERVLAAGGDVVIDSEVGEGTRVVASIPLEID